MALAERKEKIGLGGGLTPQIWCSGDLNWVCVS